MALAALGATTLGPALPLSWGWGVPVLVIAALAALSVLRDGGGAYRATPTLGAGRYAAVALVWVSAAVLIGASASLAIAVTVAFPGAVWALPVVLLGVAAAGWAGPRARLPVAIGMALLVPASGVWGARHEAAGADAHGWAHSGPIHGIHPFQMTAIRIDGYGPFDIPINDYVEPEGDRGYGPTEYADALERALHRIAEVHFADGPARAQRAFAGATVEASSMPAVEETLGVSPGAEVQPRVLVRSGGWGQHSSVQFVCPGKRDEPGGPEADNLLSRMCPNKYASEASAGLGVTGRWPGYAEGRGQPRSGIAPAQGQTRTPDARGGKVVRSERLLGAALWLGLGLLVLLVPRSRVLLVRGAPRLTGAVAVAGVTAALVLAFESSAGTGRVGMFESTGQSVSWSAWLPAMLLLAGMPEIRARAAGASTTWGSAALVIAVAAVAGSLAHTTWIVPSLRAVPGEAGPLQAWIIGAGDLLASARGMDVFETEHGIAAMVVALLAGAAWAVLGRAATSVAEQLPQLQARAEAVRVPVAAAGLLATALWFAFSRKTFGGATLVPGAIGLTVVLHSGLAWARQRSMLRGGLLALTSVGTAGLWLASISHASVPGDPWAVLFAAIGTLAALSGLALFASGQKRDA